MAEEKKSLLEQIEVWFTDNILNKKEKEVKLGSVQSGDIAIEYDGETLEVGTPVFVTQEEEKVPLPDGEYPTDMGTLVVVEGVVTEVKTEVAAETETPAAAPSPDAAVQAIKSLLVKFTEEQPNYEDRIKALEDSLLEFKTENKKLKEDVVELSEQPASKAIKTEVAQVELNKAGRILSKLRQN